MRNPRCREGVTAHRVTHQALVERVSKKGAVERIRPRLRDRVDEPPGEPPLPYVERRDQYLVFLDRLHRNGMGIRLPPRRAARGEPEQVVIHAASQLDGFGTV